MAGKSYTIKEMKTIVDYLIEKTLYGEIKGRKMWMDYANSKQTGRTWQSLKETFLKRILPDIHNPYYQLTMEQINSFRAGYDVSDKNKNKLEIHTVSDDSDDRNNKSPARNDNGIKEEILAGEKVKCSKIPTQNRSSADTVIVDTCYETAEDIQKALESPGSQDNETKSLRDCITYSEPLTPMLQEVLDDFNSEPENEPEASDRENQVDTRPDTLDSENINKNNPIENEKSAGSVNETVEKTDSAPVAVDEIQSNHETDKQNDELNKNTPIATSDGKNSEELSETAPSPVKNIEESVVTEKTSGKEIPNKTNDQLTNDVDNTIANNSENTDIIVVHDSNSEIINPSGAVNVSNSTTDASLPNNPEALKKRISDEIEPIKKVDLPGKKVDNKASRKRSNSEDTASNKRNKKTKLDRKIDKATSETESGKTLEVIAEINHIAESKKKPVTMEFESIPEKVEQPPKVDQPKQTKDVASTSGTAGIPSTSTAKDIIIDNKGLLSSDTDEVATLDQSSGIKNPCLQNVSLFDEQFNKLKYHSTDSESDSKKKKPFVEDKNKKNKANDNDTESTTSPKKKLRSGVVPSKADRDRALSNVFGFSSGAMNKRKRQLSRRRRTISQNNISQNGGTNSSEWTSDVESDVYVSPPRGRKNRQTKKYLKPKSGRILSLEEEGGLFVMYGKKIYPLVKDGKIVKNYLTYLPDSDSEEEQTYWKHKYEEEKKKAQELKKQLQKAKHPRRESTSSTTPPKPVRSSSCNHNQAQEKSNADKEICVPEKNEKRPELSSSTNISESIKIKFTTKNDQEIHLEGNWPQIHNVLEHVVHIFHKEPVPVRESRTKAVVEPPSSSGLSTPVVITSIQDPEIREKVDKIESEIFKEIEELDKEEQSEPNRLENNTSNKPNKTENGANETKSPKNNGTKEQKTPEKNGTNEPKSPENNNNGTNQTNKAESNGSGESNKQENNVTKRRAARLRKSSQSSLSLTPQKKRKTSNQSDDKEQQVDNVTVEEPKKALRSTPRRSIATPNDSNTKTVQSKTPKANRNSKTDLVNEEEEILYMLPPTSGKQTAKSTTDKKSRQKPQKSMNVIPKIIPPPDIVYSNSLESTQGYQDTDPSPVRVELRKKKMINISELKTKTISHIRRSSRKLKLPLLGYESGDSSNSSIGVPIHETARDNSTLNSNVYKSDSYQLLMPVPKSTFLHLDPIDEVRPLGMEEEFIPYSEITARNEVNSVNLNSLFRKSGQGDSDVGSSSNISLPMSPELSVVESLSVSKELLNTGEGGPTINETQCNDVLMAPAACSQYLISDIDVSVPLMQQQCGLESSNVTFNNNARKPYNIVTESLVKKIGTINIADQNNVTDNLDVKLRDLLLESAKKMTINDQGNSMDVDETCVDTKKKSRSKKRCSTPQKRKNSGMSKNAPKVQTVVEEEYVESFGKTGRQSCPPIIQALEPVVNEEINIASLTIDDNVKPKGRKKKDIIKVKILRPKSKNITNDTATSVQESRIIKSNCTDSGINDTESGVFLRADDSVDLIHNHSETCLHANECIGDSVEFVETSAKSLLSLGDSVPSFEDNLWQNQSQFSEIQKFMPEYYSNNAQNVKSFGDPKLNDIVDSETVYHSPLGTESSLITEDLSDEYVQPYVKTNKWYLLSEDETTNTNMANIDPQANIVSFGANLKQIFPITCAVPDLSTITEMSGDNDSRKATLEGASSTPGAFTIANFK